MADLRGEKVEPEVRTASRVKVALVDSGVNPEHSHVGRVAGGIHFLLDENNASVSLPDYADELGHGTALAGVLRSKAPDAELYAVKVFTDHLATSFPVLEAALGWTVTQGMHVVNLSLGLVNQAHRGQLEALVARAHAANVILVASSPPDRADVLPACLPGVIGVAADETCGWDEYRWLADQSVPFRAHPHPRPLPGPVQQHNFHGHSFAAAHVAAALARRVQRYPDLGPRGAYEYLQTLAGETPAFPGKPDED